MVQPQRCHVPPKLADWHNAIRAHVATHISVTLEGLKASLLNTHTILVSTGVLWKTLARLKLTLKKSHSGRPNKIVRTSPGACGMARQAAEADSRPACLHRRDLEQDEHDPAPWHGWAPRNQRLVEAVPHGHWNTTTFIGALRCDGLTASALFDGAMFVATIEQVLAPTLRKGDVAIIDNLRCHKVAGVREAIEAVGASLMFIPPYSPDLNPIEQAFAKLKALLRARKLRTVEALWEALGTLPNCLASAECANYLRHSGYFQFA